MHDTRFIVSAPVWGAEPFKNFAPDGEPVFVLYHPEGTGNTNVEVCRLTMLEQDDPAGLAATLTPVCDPTGGEIYLPDATPTYRDTLHSVGFVVTLTENPDHLADAV